MSLNLDNSFEIKSRGFKGVKSSFSTNSESTTEQYNQDIEDLY